MPYYEKLQATSHKLQADREAKEAASQGKKLEKAISFEFCLVGSTLGKRSMKNFKQLKIWQKGFSIATQAFTLTGTFPKEERFALAS